MIDITPSTGSNHIRLLVSMLPLTLRLAKRGWDEFLFYWLLDVLLVKLESRSRQQLVAFFGFLQLLKINESVLRGQVHHNYFSPRTFCIFSIRNQKRWLAKFYLMLNNNIFIKKNNLINFGCSSTSGNCSFVPSRICLGVL